MTKKYFILLLTTVLLTAVPAAQAQQTGKLFRIGLLDPSDASSSSVRLKAFWEEIRRLGWIEGKNIIVEYRFAEEKTDRLTALAADLVRLKVDLIVCSSTAAALASKRVTTAIPIVMANAADPVGAGLVASLARPGGNVTGVSGLAVELNTKRLEVLKDAVPKLSRVALPLLQTAAVSEELQRKELRLAAVALRVKLEEIKTNLDPKSLDSAFQTAKQKRVGAMITIGRPFFAERKRFVELAVKYRLRAIYPQKEYVDVGGLMYYGIDSVDNYRRAAGYVDKILKGAKPADLPVQQATKFEFVINLKAAKQIGLALSPEFLSRANQVIQ
jgi:putative ABC transport system substrate-binding protein